MEKLKVEGKGNLRWKLKETWRRRKWKVVEGCRIWWKFGEKVETCGGRKGIKEKEKKEKKLKVKIFSWERK